jgi:hypothetical protein
VSVHQVHLGGQDTKVSRSDKCKARPERVAKAIGEGRDNVNVRMSGIGEEVGKPFLEWGRAKDSNQKMMELPLRTRT